VYAGCVLWPLKLDSSVGWVGGSLVALIIFIQYVAGLIKGRAEITSEPSVSP
jgi:hypothetical protein